jgi:hypothetical protein
MLSEDRTMDNTVRIGGTGVYDSISLWAGPIIGWLAGFGVTLLLAPQSNQNEELLENDSLGG